MLTSESYEFATAEKCKVKDCYFTADTAMEIFKHIRENHMKIVKKLKIKIGDSDSQEKSKDDEDETLIKKRPGPRSKTMMKPKQKSISAKEDTIEMHNKNILSFDFTPDDVM